LQNRFLPVFSPLAPIGLLYTILVMFAYQGHHIVENIGPVFRVFVPLILYFVIMWAGAFALMLYLSRREKLSQGGAHTFGYEMAVVQSFTAGSNNFVSPMLFLIPRWPVIADDQKLIMKLQELAIAVAIAVYGVDSDQALAATIGPLVEVPVLLALTWVSLFLGRKLEWTSPEKTREKVSADTV
jgi:ACR3 family arsenite transporter